MTYLKYLCQLHFLVVEDGMYAVHSLLGLVGGAPLCFLMQNGNECPGEHREEDETARLIQTDQRLC